MGDVELDRNFLYLEIGIVVLDRDSLWMADAQAVGVRDGDSI